MEPEAVKTIELAALGRPFGLGMLYDCCQDSLIPGMTLWDPDALEKDARERPQPNSEFEIVASESIEHKSSALNVDASLKASFLAGLVEVGGSAKYLNDSKISKNQARVTLKYKTTTKYQELSMNHLGRGNVKHQYIFDQGIATHVVTGILYGAQAFFVFDREVSEKEDHKDIEGNLKVMIQQIPGLVLQGQHSLQKTETDTVNVQKFSCKFYGDFNVQRNPVSFQDAIEVYQSLPKLLGANGENAVPVKVWLMPLKSLDSAAAQLVRQISVRLVTAAQSVLEDFNELEMRCNDAMKQSTIKQFPQIGKKLKTFKELLSEYKLEIQTTLAKKLPSIRGGVEKESVLAEVFKKRHSSPFNSKNLSEWMSCKEREINILKSLTNMMKNTEIVTSRYALDQEILSAEHAVCFAFTSVEDDEPYLSDLSEYLQETPESPQEITYQIHDIKKENWCFLNEVWNAMRQKAKLFNEFAQINMDNNIRFLIASVASEKKKGASIHLYKEGSLVSENFEPPSKPEKPAVSDTTHNSVTVKISPPGFGTENITHYSVEYCVSGEDDWQQMTVLKAGEVTVSSLTPNTEYLFRCRAVCSVGKGPASDVSGPITTLQPTSPPGKLQAEPNLNELSVSWEKPAEIGKGVNILSYIVEYAKTAPGVKHEELEWNQMVSQVEKAIISGLKPETEYAVRVRCDCGVAGRSKESNTVNVWTKKQVHLSEFLKHKSKLINSASPSVYKLPLKKEAMDIDGCRSYSFGKESLRRNRTIMVLGATGSGKSTLINGMINYIVGVKWNDKFRFKLTDEDVAENIQMLVTFADGQRPPVLEAINVSGVPWPKTDAGLPVHFKFNNSALFADNTSINDKSGNADSDEDMDDDNFDEMFWNMGAKSMKNFFTALDRITTKSLQMTKEVLKERKQLETAIEELQQPLKCGFVTLQQLKMINQKHEEHKEMSVCSIARLKEIALRPNPLSTPEYIDLLIEGEKSEAKEGYLARIQSLERLPAPSWFTCSADGLPVTRPAAPTTTNIACSETEAFSSTSQPCLISQSATPLRLGLPSLHPPALSIT
ncbi:uncharacterized protein LOC115375357 [Myripristis murdjan]|uniref:uncharacterized protein LOC115375357 n=1 Tax=Myripristis murdjan TaxID=586833 RepID=UPI0011760B2A|nr:uncharacterized protein LOC115375357 [Myripristis murdjan]